ncbi:hypothetical protein Tdes44962_MAKER06409 [Teratosphaeria destructans]|uniref:Uncharacterized protein n=1 Tax=Teratosphaeria destructans TaxID=418781 RepID=A0A9W7T256_9PEZI|nr:hypothetical protein Tdes44962_MAKER06409 [Teratosphaeria destructans]
MLEAWEKRPGWLGNDYGPSVAFLSLASTQRDFEDAMRRSDTAPGMWDTIPGAYGLVSGVCCTALW